MILGKKDELDDGLETLFSDNGIGHILAISGLHISLIGMALYKLIKRTGAGDILSMAASVTIIGVYGIMTGNNVSTVRAVVMFLQWFIQMLLRKPTILLRHLHLRQ